MTERPPPPAPAPGRAGSAGGALAAGWGRAAVGGGLAFVVMALIGQAAALAVQVATRAGLSAANLGRLGWLYFQWFHHVTVEVTVPRLDLGGAFGSSGLGISNRSFGVGVGVGLALLALTLLAGGLLYAAGRSVAERSEGGALARALHGAKVAPFYAVPAFVISLLAVIRFPLPQNAFANGSVEVRASPAQALLLPLLIAAVAGAAGGLASARSSLREAGTRSRSVLGALAGGVRMLALGLALSFAGLLVLAVAEPDATRAYFDGVTAGDAAETTVLISHHVLVLPNQSMWVLVPAMGGCDVARGSGVSVSFLCYWRFPRSVSGSSASLTALRPPSVRFGRAPAGYLLFLLVPLLSVLLGGAWAAARGAPASRREAAAIGAGAGVAFAVLVAAAAWFAGVGASYSVGLAGIGGGTSVQVGPDPVGGSLLALAWGVVGGAAGAWWWSRKPSRLAARPAPAVASSGWDRGGSASSSA